MIRCMAKSVQQNGVYLIGMYEGAYCSTFMYTRIHKCVPIHIVHTQDMKCTYAPIVFT